MIEFQEIEYKNFMSVGNAPIKIKLNENKLTLILGKNGHGKSIIVDGIAFALYGKAFRDINKNQLINSINQKQCLVTIHFKIGDIQYKVVRGIKPNIFEIYKNDELINQDAKAKDYQKVLEQQIIGISFRVFTQVVVLGSAAFTPFMKLPLAARREVIDDILDIRIITTMNGILKDMVSKNKQNLLLVDANIKSQTDLIKAQQRLIESIKATASKQQEDGESKKEELLKEIDAHLSTMASNQQKLENLQAKYDEKIGLKDELKTVDQAILVNKTHLGSKTKIKDNVSKLDECPTCLQSVDENHVKKLCETIDKEVSEYGIMLKNLNESRDAIIQEAKILKSLSDEISSINQNQALLNNTIKGLNRQVSDISTPVINDGKKETEELTSLVQYGKELVSEKNELLNNKEIQDIAAVLLKDTGVKTAIIKEYLPIMNNLINKYLYEMDSYVSFTFDENFNEVIASRYRDQFTYASFSEGEKARINIAILLCWREIAKMKNSVHTNLLFMDEIVDSSMDYEGITSVIGMLENMEGNIFVISHRQESQDKFSNVIEFEKVGDYTRIKE